MAHCAENDMEFRASNDSESVCLWMFPYGTALPSISFHLNQRENTIK